MKHEEISANNYLRDCYGENVVFEPDGNIPPDFAVNSIIAVEVRRLNQHFYDGEKTEGLKQLSYPLYDALKDVLESFNTQYSGKSYFVSIDYERPLGKSMGEIKREIQIALKEFLQNEALLPCKVNINEKIEFWIDKSMPINGRVFRLGGEIDGDAGGWVISEYIDNIKFCIAQKSSKISQYLPRYKVWWLCLVDYMNLGLDHDDVKQVKSALTNLNEFARVIVINRTGEFLLFETTLK